LENGNCHFSLSRCWEPSQRSGSKVWGEGKTTALLCLIRLASDTDIY
jgi:hypothetical protein